MILVMDDGTEIIIKADSYECPSMPSFAKVLMIAFPPSISQRVSSMKLQRRYGWRVQRAIEAIVSAGTPPAGAGV